MAIPAIFSGNTGTRLWKISNELESGVIFILLPESTLINDSEQFINACEAGFEAETVSKPWGSYTTLYETPNFKVKCILVKPLASLSLQSHKKRSEHWFVYKGRAQVINGDQEYFLGVDETTFIPKNVKHRITNAESGDLIIMEVQIGAYLREDDIIRYEDLYDRV